MAKQEPRLKNSITYEVTKPPAFAFVDTAAVIKMLRTQLVFLSSRIAEANAVNKIVWKGEEISLAMVIKLLSELKSQIALLKELVANGIPRINEINDEEREETIDEDIVDSNGRFMGQRRKEVKRPVKVICKLTISACDEELNRLEGEFEELNNLVEQANHKVLIEIPVKDTKSSELS